MDPKNPGATLEPEGGGDRSGLIPGLGGLDPGEAADEGLSGCAQDHGKAEPGQFAQPGDQLDVVRDGLAESDTGVDGDGGRVRTSGDDPVRNVLVYSDGELAAYGHLDVTDEVEGASAEVVVHPSHRRRGFGRLLVQATLDETPDGRLRLWAHGGHAGAAAHLERAHFGVKLKHI